MLLLDTVLLALGSGVSSSLRQLRLGLGLAVAGQSKVAVLLSNVTTSLGDVVMTGGCAKNSTVLDHVHNFGLVKCI